MIDKFIIFNKHGVVLWSKSLGANVHSEPVTRLIHDVLLEEKKGETVFEYENYALKWTFANELDLVFVVVYQKLLQLLYLDDLLEAVKQAGRPTTLCERMSAHVRLTPSRAGIRPAVPGRYRGRHVSCSVQCVLRIRPL